MGLRMYYEFVIRECKAHGVTFLSSFGQIENNKHVPLLVDCATISALLRK
jgi:hypothetical protein